MHCVCVLKSESGVRYSRHVLTALVTDRPASFDAQFVLSHVY